MELWDRQLRARYQSFIDKELVCARVHWSSEYQTEYKVSNCSNKKASRGRYDFFVRESFISYIHSHESRCMLVEKLDSTS